MGLPTTNHLYLQRLEDLVLDGYLAFPPGDQVLLTSKGVENMQFMLQQGLVKLACREPRHAQLTQKGLSVLMACADRPLKSNRGGWHSPTHIPIRRK